jgi:hypothetical protein
VLSSQKLGEASSDLLTFPTSLDRALSSGNIYPEILRIGSIGEMTTAFQIIQRTPDYIPKKSWPVLKTLVLLGLNSSRIFGLPSTVFCRMFHSAAMPLQMRTGFQVIHAFVISPNRNPFWTSYLNLAMPGFGISYSPNWEYTKPDREYEIEQLTDERQGSTFLLIHKSKALHRVGNLATLSVLYRSTKGHKFSGHTSLISKCNVS